MLDLTTAFGADRVDGTFPSIVAKNNTTAESNDGTPFTATLVNEFFGVLQAIMVAGSETPSGVNETYSTSQVLNAIRNICGNAGELVAFSGSYNKYLEVYIKRRILALVGQIVLVASYPTLIESVWDETENATTEGWYRCTNGDGSGRSVSGIYLHVPDYRDMFVRGIPTSGRDVNSLQEDSIKEHQHYITSPTLGSDYYGRALNGSTSGTEKYLRFVVGIEPKAVAGQSPINQTNTEETRPSNRAIIWCVRY